MQFDTKIAVAIRTDLEVWQKLNVASFLTSGIAAAFPECIGAPYEAPSQPDLVLGTCDETVEREVERVLEVLVARGILSG